MWMINDDSHTNNCQIETQSARSWTSFSTSILCSLFLSPYSSFVIISYLAIRSLRSPAPHSLPLPPQSLFLRLELWRRVVSAIPFEAGGAFMTVLVVVSGVTWTRVERARRRRVASGTPFEGMVMNVIVVVVVNDVTFFNPAVIKKYIHFNIHNFKKIKP